MSEQDAFYQHVRHLQRQTRCSDKVCKEFVKLYRKFHPDGVTSSINAFDVKVKKAAGCYYHVLHGCPNCNRHVYKPTDDERACPVCGHSRFDDKNQPQEIEGDHIEQVRRLRGVILGRWGD